MWREWLRQASVKELELPLMSASGLREVVAAAMHARAKLFRDEAADAVAVKLEVLLLKTIRAHPQECVEQGPSFASKVSGCEPRAVL